MKTSLDEQGIKVWMIKRYMDDTRKFLPLIKPGWRMEDMRLVYTNEWELEDKMMGVSGTVRSKKTLLRMMNQVEDYLTFTAETGEEYGGWAGHPP